MLCDFYPLNILILLYELSWQWCFQVPKGRRMKDKWRSKKWYNVITPSYFGSVDVGSVPTDDPDKLLGKTIDSTLYDVTEDFAHQYLKMFFQIINVEGKIAYTIFKGHEYSRDYLEDRPLAQ